MYMIIYVKDVIIIGIDNLIDIYLNFINSVV